MYNKTAQVNCAVCLIDIEEGNARCEQGCTYEYRNEYRLFYLVLYLYEYYQYDDK